MKAFLFRVSIQICGQPRRTMARQNLKSGGQAFGYTVLATHPMRAKLRKLASPVGGDASFTGGRGNRNDDACGRDGAAPPRDLLPPLRDNQARPAKAAADKAQPRSRAELGNCMATSGRADPQNVSWAFKLRGSDVAHYAAGAPPGLCP